MRFRLLLPGYAGAEDGPGGSGGACEGEDPCCVAAHDPARGDVDAGGVPLVHLPVHRHLACRGGWSIWEVGGAPGEVGGAHGRWVGPWVGGRGHWVGGRIPQKEGEISEWKGSSVKKGPVGAQGGA